MYAQLEGGIKDLASCVLRDLNLRHMSVGDIKPELLQWRNPNEINRFRSMVDFNMIAIPRRPCITKDSGDFFFQFLF